MGARLQNDPEFAAQVADEVRDVAEYIGLREKFESWGFAPVVDRYVQGLIDESGYRVTTSQEKGGDWAVTMQPKNDGKFDSALARKPLDELDTRRNNGTSGLNGENKDLLTLADKLSSAARTSLEKHGDLRDAVKEMGDYILRNQRHPNASKRDDLHGVLHLFVTAREQYERDVESYFGGTLDDITWFDERVKQFQDIAEKYLDTPNAHTRWLTDQISAWLLRPYTEVLRQSSSRSSLTGPPDLVSDFIKGMGWKKPWSTVVSLSISALLFLLFVALVVACYRFFNPMAAYGVAGLWLLFHARRYIQARMFRKERARLMRSWSKVCDLHNELTGGIYNAGEVIRRFREIEADGVALPSIFVGVISLPEGQPPGI